MPYDAKLVLHGLNSADAHVELDETTVNSILLAVNLTGGKVLDIKKTGCQGLTASLVLTEVADVDSYDDESTIVIQDSDHLAWGWNTIATFPTLHSHIRRVWVTNTVAFVAADITQGLTAQGGDTGQLLDFDESLLVAGGTGYIYIEMDAVGDDFDDAVGQTMNSAGTGRSTVTTQSPGLEPNIQMQPGIYNRSFVTKKRYIRAHVTVADGQGNCWILLTDVASTSQSPEYNATIG